MTELSPRGTKTNRDRDAANPSKVSGEISEAIMATQNPSQSLQIAPIPILARLKPLPARTAREFHRKKITTVVATINKKDILPSKPLVNARNFFCKLKLCL